MEARKSRIYHPGSRDSLLEAKDAIIAELRSQVALLRSELRRKDAVLSRIAENIDELSLACSSDAANGPRAVATGEVAWVDAPAPDGRQRQEKLERPTLPDGYRVVAIASDAWVLVTTIGVRVAGYRGELDLWKVALDAREHYEREQ